MEGRLPRSAEIRDQFWETAATALVRPGGAQQGRKKKKKNGVNYRIKKYLGHGGFGTAYLAVELNRSGGEKQNSESCLKIALRADEWHGEVYFANLLRNVGHVVEMKSAFPTRIFDGRTTRIAFAINMEWVLAGTVRDACDKGEAQWTEAQVRKRVRLLLKPLALLHSMGVSHRDVTPPNVFVGDRKVLKLGDFGITKAQLHPSGVHADILNPDFAPRLLGRWWGPADDVYQVGLLMATLLAGEEVGTGVKKPEINRITKRDAIKAAISVKARDLRLLPSWRRCSPNSFEIDEVSIEFRPHRRSSPARDCSPVLAFASPPVSWTCGAAPSA